MTGRDLRRGHEDFPIAQCSQMGHGATKVYNCEANFVVSVIFLLGRASPKKE